MSRNITIKVLFAIYLLGACSTTQDQAKMEERPVDLVSPLVDAANSRWFFFNSATRPFGMVNLSPDMVISGAWNSGYRYHQDTIRAFSHIHAWQLSGVPVFPTVGEFRGHQGPDIYGSAFSHEGEEIRPGYHQIFLDRYDVNVELTSTTRVGFHRYTFPQSDQSHILVDLSTFLGPCDTEYGFTRKISDREIEGYAVMGGTRRRPKAVKVFFVIQFDQEFESYRGWREGTLIEGEDTIEGPRVGTYVSFQTSAEDQRLMKVAISYTSIEAARNNLDAELPHWDFDQVVKDSDEIWNDWLSKIRVKGNSLKARQRFYTDLWHALQGRRIISDASGTYCDMTGDTMRVGQIPLDGDGLPRFNHYNSDSFWGAQWTINTLWQLVYPKVAWEFVQSMMLMYRDGGLIPRGPSGGNYTYVMTGASSTPFVVAAYQKGLLDENMEEIYQALRKNHMPGGIMSKAGYEHDTHIGGGLDFYIDRGYIPYPLPDRGYGFHENGSGQTLEYAYQDGCLSQLALALQKEEDRKYFYDRSQNYRNVWNSQDAWMWIRNVDGKWQAPFDEFLYGKGFVESNAAQMTWFVPHDVAGLIDLMGGQDKFVSKLHHSFAEAREHAFTSGKSHDSETQEALRRTYINYGNQPSMQTAFLFNYAGSPWLTQYWSRQVVDSVYSDLTHDLGYSGDEDQGLMGSLAVLMKIGLFSMDGGTATEPQYEIGSPIFEEVQIDLDSTFYSGEKFTISVDNQGTNHWYIQKARLNNKKLDQWMIPHRTLVGGGKLELVMDSEPNKEWGLGE